MAGGHFRGTLVAALLRLPLGAFQLLEQGDEVGRQGPLDPKGGKAAQIAPVSFGADQAPNATIHDALPFVVPASHRSALASFAKLMVRQNGSCLACTPQALPSNRVKF